MISFTSALNLFSSQTTVTAAAAATPQAPSALRAPSTASLLFAASVGLAALVSGCGARTELWDGEERPTPADAGGSDGGVADAGPTDAGVPDASPPDAGTDAGPMPLSPVSDVDCDDVTDLEDNCPLTPNAHQSDVDHDGLGDVCDVDSLNDDFDGDGILDGEEIGVLGSDATKADTDGDGIGDGVDACPTTAGTLTNQGCLPQAATCDLEAVAYPTTLCDGTFVEGFRILWSTTNASDATLAENGTPLTRRRSGQVYVYPTAPTLFTLDAASPFGTCHKSVTVTP